MQVSDLIRTAVSPKGPFPLAVLAQGQFADAYGGREPVDEEIPAEAAAPGTKNAKTAENKAAPAALKPAPGKLILIGAVTPFQKQLLQGGGHLNFFLNSMDILTLGDALIGIRSKTVADRSLPRISRAAKVMWRFFVIFLVPALIMAAGIAHFYWRRRSQKQYLKSLSQ
jgi:ABC-type uncharacterized transport system involved in gliding motility auxiliary subunit